MRIVYIKPIILYNSLLDLCRGFLAIIVSGFIVSCSPHESAEGIVKVKSVDLMKYSSQKPSNPMHLIFIHHSCGGQLLADKGMERGQNCIYETHPNGGGLRSQLEINNYIVHEASYGSVIGEETDVCQWNRKFRKHMDQILSLWHQDELFRDGTKNRIVVFKSCYPNNYIELEGDYPGDPDSCVKALANYKAAYNALLPYFQERPDTLFVVVTAPPLVKPSPNRIKELAKVLLGRENTLDKIGIRARNFNNWLKDTENGWLKDYPIKNVVVFDLYDVLTDYGRSNWTTYPSNGNDSHPNDVGNAKVVEVFIPFLNRAVSRMGL